ncbi:Hypothetical predicted protein [Lynx pardinus]|uniref:Uncharacterized protein n=1 Tax=Lynx pardinus TaxID=191816 RepID=A0A485N1E2_LYNPA|nr:Hypothetical predicted protein [Lynx pardinus]
MNLLRLADAPVLLVRWKLCQLTVLCQTKSEQYDDFSSFRRPVTEFQDSPYAPDLDIRSSTARLRSAHQMLPIRLNVQDPMPMINFTPFLPGNL